MLEMWKNLFIIMTYVHTYQSSASSELRRRTSQLLITATRDYSYIIHLKMFFIAWILEMIPTERYSTPNGAVNRVMEPVKRLGYMVITISRLPPISYTMSNASVSAACPILVR